MVVHGLDHLDEITITTKTKVSELKDNKIIDYYIDPREYDFPLANSSDLVGGSSRKNADIIINILKGEKGPKRDIVLFNAGAAIYVGKQAHSLNKELAKPKKSLTRALHWIN